MGTKNSGGAGRQVPLVTLLVVAGGLVTYVIPGLASQMVYDRAAILFGEGWRLFSGGHPHFGLLCVLSALSIGAVLLAMTPEMQFYGGLSGVATGAILCLALHGLKEPGPWRWICLAAIALTLGKVVLESVTGRLTFAAVDRVPFAPVPIGHVIGGVTARLIFCYSTARSLSR